MCSGADTIEGEEQLQEEVRQNEHEVEAKPQMERTGKVGEHLEIELQLLKEQFEEQEAKYKQLEEDYELEQHTHQQAMGDLLGDYEKQKEEYEKEINQLTAEKGEAEQAAMRFEQSWKVSYKDVSVTKEELGRGGRGVVHVGVFMEQKVAVKQLNTVVLDESSLAIMNREISNMSRLHHPNLLLFIGAALDNPFGHPLIITEIMDTNLRKAYEEGQLTEERATRLSILRDTAAGLNYLHCHPDQIIHGDVSSANVLLESRGLGKWRAKLSGLFGCARNVFSETVDTVEVYEAPETLLTYQSWTTKMDVYSYGVLACEVMCGQFPESVAVFYTMLQSIASSSPSAGQLIQDCVKENPDNRLTMKRVNKLLKLMQ